MYEGRIENGTFIIKGYGGANRVAESQFADGIVRSGRTYNDYIFNGKVVLHSEVVVSLLEE